MNAAAPSPVMRISLARKVLFVSLFVAALAVPLVEALGHVWLRRSASGASLLELLDPDRVESFRRHYARPDGGYEPFPVERSMPAGYEDSLRALRRTPDRAPFVAVVGDSMMAQAAVPEASRTSTLLEQWLAREGRSSVKVANVAIPGLNATQEAWLLDTHVTPTRPDLVLWVTFIVNDFESLPPMDARGVQTQRDLRHRGAGWMTLKRSFLLGYVYPRLRLIRGLDLLPAFLALNPYSDYYELELSQLAVNVDAFCSALVESSARAERDGVAVVHLVLPDLYGLDLPNQPWLARHTYPWSRETDQVVACLSGHASEVVDLREPLSRWKIPPRIDGTHHLSPQGASDLAAVLSETLRRTPRVARVLGLTAGPPAAGTSPAPPT